MYILIREVNILYSFLQVLHKRRPIKFGTVKVKANKSMAEFRPLGDH